MRHSVDFGLSVIAMTQVISCQLFDCRAKAASRELATTTPQFFCLLMIVASPCSNLTFAVRVSEPVTLIFVPPVEMPAPCHARLGETTLKPCESFAVCRTRLSLPCVLRSTSLLRQHEKSTQHAKVASAPNLRMPLTLASGGENNRSIASPANLCPTGDRRTPRGSVNLRTLSLGRFY